MSLGSGMDVAAVVWIVDGVAAHRRVKTVKDGFVLPFMFDYLKLLGAKNVATTMQITPRH